LRRLVAAVTFAACAAPAPLHAQHGPAFDISFPASAHQGPITGRVLLFLASDSTPAPRFQGGALGSNGPVFGIDVSELAPNAPASLDGATLGFPVATLGDMPPGDYYAQAVMNVYTQAHRADGHTIWVHMDQWEGQQYGSSSGNLVSGIVRVHIGAHSAGVTRLSLSTVIPPAEVPADTKWVKHVKIQSALLTKFWGHPMYLGAVVLLPKGYDEHPDVHYPVDYEQDHFSVAAPYHFQEEAIEPADSNVVGHRAWVVNLRKVEGYRLYQDWTSDSFPRMLMVTFLHPTPYFDDSYAVNSANDGPYGDAIMTELVPYIESHYRIIRQPYARVLSGGSTGGWESLALQVYHPEFFGGAWVYYPDPVDFRQWALIDIYKDANAFTLPGAKWVVPERPMFRSTDGQVLITERQLSQLEAVLGSHGRSAEQQEAWEAVYGPVGADGYPKPLWNKATGAIDHSVATYMRDHGFDLTAYMREHWSTIGPQLVGKLHFYAGDMDNFYLNMAVYRAQDFLSQTKDPYFGGTFDYGRPMKGHGIRPTSTGDMLRTMAKQIARDAPAGSDTTAWMYH
jgi:hypothetical protein